MNQNFMFVSTYDVDELAQAVLLVEQVEDDAEGEGHGEEHGCVTATRLVRALEQPQHDAHQLHDRVGRKLAHALHRVLEVGQVVETHGHTGGRDGRTMHFKQTLHSTAMNELRCQLLVTQQ